MKLQFSALDSKSGRDNILISSQERLDVICNLKVEKQKWLCGNQPECVGKSQDILHPACV